MTEAVIPGRLRMRQFIRCIAIAGGLAFVAYGLFLVLGFVPGRWSYRPPDKSDAVRIFVRSNEIHTDLVLPVRGGETQIDWREMFPPNDFLRDVQRDEWISIGWGNRQFYVETPTWAEFKLTTAAGALFWPSESVLHVEYLPYAEHDANMRPVLIPRGQYRALADFVKTSVGQHRDSGAAMPVTTVTYGSSDRFYASSGRYHAVNTCNQWTGRGLARAGVPVGIWTPLKAHVHCWLPEEKPTARD
jgi:uncharacterized protein (TIGR02117 family)